MKKIKLISKYRYIAIVNVLTAVAGFTILDYSNFDLEELVLFFGAILVGTIGVLLFKESCWTFEISEKGIAKAFLRSRRTFAYESIWKIEVMENSVLFHAADESFTCSKLYKNYESMIERVLDKNDQTQLVHSAS